MHRRGLERVWAAAAFVAGFLLRAAFIAHHPRFAGDALVYGELAHHVLHEHVYGLIDNAVLKPTLIRLPGYPLFLAALFKVFGDANYLAVLWVQLFVDLVTCGLIAATARRVAGTRAGMWALWLSALCPFTANYVAVAIAETCSLFCVALAFYGLTRCIEARRSGLPMSQTRDAGQPRFRWVVMIGLALAWAVLLRPDQGLLAAAVVPAMLWVGTRSAGAGLVKRVAPAAVVSLIVTLPLAVWAGRNWRVFRVVQPLAPKYANDPGEAVPYGFMRWFRTWAIGYPATVNVYWRYDGDPMSMSDLPARAFDNERQRAETAVIFDEYNREDASTPPVDARFAKLAEERVRANPLRYYVFLPVARMLDMWLRPRTELLKVPLDWWRVREHPRSSMLAFGFAALNVFYLVLAKWGWWRWRSVRWSGYAALMWAMVGFVVLRCVLLLTIDNSEMRYTLELYPVVLVLCGIAMMSGREVRELMRGSWEGLRLSGRTADPSLRSG
jgi:hypothetical protein